MSYYIIKNIKTQIQASDCENLLELLAMLVNLDTLKVRGRKSFKSGIVS